MPVQGTFLFELTPCLYYAMVVRVLDGAGDYAWAVGLDRNLKDPDCRHKVENIFLRYCGGNHKRLEEMIRDRKDVCVERMTELQNICYGAGVEAETDIDGTIELLVDPKWRNAFRRYAKKYELKGEIHSIPELKAEYARNSAKQAKRRK